MKLFNENIKKEALKNNYFRRVLYTGKNSQVVVMALNPKEDIGMEVHKKYDQVIVIVKGNGFCELNKNKSRISPDSLIYVPKGTWHNFTNIGKTKMKLFTMYSPANHPPGTIHKTKAEAEAKEKD